MTLLPALVFASSCASAPDVVAAEAPAALAPCPSTPNCVSSQGDPGDEQHYVEPLARDGALEALEELRAQILAMPRTALVSEGPGYLHATFTSRVWRFVDDVELLAMPDGVLHVRSASRVGHGDLGVNRARVEALRSSR